MLSYASWVLVPIVPGAGPNIVQGTILARKMSQVDSGTTVLKHKYTFEHGSEPFSDGPGPLHNGFRHLFWRPPAQPQIPTALLLTALGGVLSLNPLGSGFPDLDKRTLFVRCLRSLRTHILIVIARICTEIQNNTNARNATKLHACKGQCKGEQR